MFTAVWIDCGQCESLLELLTPLLSRPVDHYRITNLLGATIGLNPTAFVRFINHRLDLVSKAIQRNPYSDGIQFKKLIEMKYLVLPWHESTTPEQPIQQQRHFYNPSEDPNNTAFSDHLDTLTFRSTIDEKVVITANLGLVYLRWPFVKRALDSGLAESISKTVELPLSENAIKAVLQTLYTGLAPDVTPGVALEILEEGLEIGLYDPSKLDQLGHFAKISLSKRFDLDSAFFNVLVLNCARVWFEDCTERGNPLESANLLLNSILPNWVHLYLNNYEPSDRTALTRSQLAAKLVVQGKQLTLHPATNKVFYYST